MLRHYPDARHIEAPTWVRFCELWAHDCSEYHYHERDVPQTPTSTPPSSPTSLTATLAASTEADKNYDPIIPPTGEELIKKFEEFQTGRIASQREVETAEAFKVQKNLVASIAATASPEPKMYFLPHNFDLARMNAAIHHPTSSQLGIRDSEGVERPPIFISDDEDEGGAEELPALIDDAGNVLRGDTPLMYAVSGHNRVFHDE